MTQRFGKEQKLKSKKEIDKLFKKGKRLHSELVTLIVRKEKTSEPSLPLVLVSVPKRNFKKAVTRNLLKRRLREAYRFELSASMLRTVTSYQFYFALVYKDKRIRDFNEIRVSIAVLLRKLEEQK